MKLTDTHCHLNDDYFYDNASTYINNFENDNLLRVFVVGYDFISSKRAVELANKYDTVYAIIGMHPEDCASYNEEFKQYIIDNADNPKVIGIGEIGLDYHYGIDNKQLQKEVFIDQIKLADQLKLPIIIHVRDAIGDLIELLKSNQQYLNNGGIIHCFNESIESYKILKGLGFKFSFGGAITFKNSKNAPKLLETVDINDILLETDSPYLTPEPLRGKERNQPKYVKYVAEKIAEYKNMSTEDIIYANEKNILDLFKKVKG